MLRFKDTGYYCAKLQDLRKVFRAKNSTYKNGQIVSKILQPAIARITKVTSFKHILVAKQGGKVTITFQKQLKRPEQQEKPKKPIQKYSSDELAVLRTLIKKHNINTQLAMLGVEKAGFEPIGKILFLISQRPTYKPIVDMKKFISQSIKNAIKKVNNKQLLKHEAGQ